MAIDTAREAKGATRDNLGHRTHFRYDGRGNRTLVTDALGNTWETVYNLADQVVSTQQPATGQSAAAAQLAW
ncbi:MAG: RHS repeat protein [Fimbriimonadaceae bacterium]|nr:RHS repeat protein [Fimbriimonadaceae bacterium]